MSYQYDRRTASNKVSSGWEGKLVGQDFRLSWKYYGWTLEELPQNGKRKLRVAQMRTFLEITNHSGVNTSAFIPENILQAKGVRASDSYDTVKNKIQEGFLEAAEEVIATNPSSRESLGYIFKNAWNEDLVSYLKVTPENTEPITAEGKDFSVKAKWTEFSAYSPESDMQLSDPHYTEIASTAPASARKLYQILKANPNALKNLPFSKFDEFLKAQKINYTYHHSTWS